MSGGEKPKEELSVRLSADEIRLLIEALDSHEYWQLGHVLPRKNGLVFIPGDREPDSIWEDVEPDEEQRGAIRGVERCRTLASRLDSALDGRP